MQDEKIELDYQSMMVTAKREGHKQGKIEGKIEGQEEERQKILEMKARLVLWTN